MPTKAYFMIKLDNQIDQQHYLSAIEELKALPEVKSIESIDGCYDLVVMIETVQRVIFTANKIRTREWVKGFLVLKIMPEAPLIEESERISVLVVDDHNLMREGIRSLLSLQKDMEVVAEAANGQDALDKVASLQPDVVLMDIAMPVMNGLEAVKRMAEEGGLAKALMLSQYDDPESVLASSEAGAWGFVPKSSASKYLVDGIRSVSQGKPFMPSNVS